MPTTVLYNYWTDFDRRNPNRHYNLVCGEVVYDPPWWHFRTNLSPEDLKAMKVSDQEIFLKKMWEIYRYRKVS